MLSDALCARCDDFKTAKTVSVLSLQCLSQLCRLFLFKRVTDKTLHSMVLLVIFYLLFFPSLCIRCFLYFTEFVQITVHTRTCVFKSTSTSNG